MPNEAFCLPGSTAVQELLERQDEGYLPPGHIYGLTLSNNGDDGANDIDIESGCCRSTANAAYSHAQAASRLIRHQRDIEIPDTTKRLDSVWAPGNGGGRSAATLADGTWHKFAIGGKRVRDSVFFHNSVTESSVLAAMPGGYTAYRRIGSVIRSSSAIKAFSQYGDEFLWLDPVKDVDTTNPGASSVTAPVTVPSGLKVLAIVNGYLVDTVGVSRYLWVRSPDQTDSAGSSANFTTYFSNTNGNGTAPFQTRVRTNTTGQLKYRLSGSGAGTTVVMNTQGFIDSLGRYF